LSLFAVKYIFGEDLCWSIRGRVIKLDVEQIVLGQCGVIGEEWESQIIGVFILFIFTCSIIINRGIESTVGKGLSKCKWGGISVVDVHGRVLW